ncbi:MAG: 4'-phosphopantetheinyl transferase superfamily protein [Halioglobus sp.]
MALIAIGGPGEIGVDIERIRTLNDMDAVAGRNFSPEENMSLSCASARERCKLFYEIWTRKEAVIKANGQGLSIPLPQFTAPIGSAGQWQVTTIEDHDQVKYLLCGLDLEPGYCSSVCIELASAEPVRYPTLKVHQYNLTL